MRPDVFTVDESTLTLKDAARILAVSVKTVRREIDRRRLIAFRAGGSLRITSGELRRYMMQGVVTI
jgi:excisionase family DNA binding protein